MKSAVVGLALAMLWSTAAAQNYSDRTVKVIVPYTPGGGTDTVARAISQRLSEKWGQPVVVENRAGAGTTIGTDFVAKAPPDGYTLLFSDSSSFVINPHIYDKLPFDPLKNLEPIALASSIGARAGDRDERARNVLSLMWSFTTEPAGGVIDYFVGPACSAPALTELLHQKL